MYQTLPVNQSFLRTPNEPELANPHITSADRPPYREYAHAAESGAAFSVACAHAYRGKSDQAFRWLDRAYERSEQALIAMMADPFLGNIQGDPKYKAFLRKMKIKLPK